MNTQSRIHPIHGDPAKLASELHMRWILDVLSANGVPYAELVPLLDSAGMPANKGSWAAHLWARAGIEIMLIAASGDTHIYKSETQHGRILIGVWKKPAVLVKQGSRSELERHLLVRHS